MQKSPTVHRVFERYSSEDRANLAAWHRSGPTKRHAVGEFYYVSDVVTGVGFSTRGEAERAEAALMEGK